MSRTDKDAPFWVRAEFYEPDHDWNCPERIAKPWQRYRRAGHCTLPLEPVRNDTSRIRRIPRLIPEVLECQWTPSGWDRRYYTHPSAEPGGP